jgi:hypothetical protein
VIAFEPHVRRLGPEMRLWSASYVLYLLVVFFPQSSIFRLLLPLAPLYGAIAAPRHSLAVGVLRSGSSVVVDLPDAGDRELVHPDPLIATLRHAACGRCLGIPINLTGSPTTKRSPRWQP